MALTGRCQCGAVTFTVDAEPLEIYVCHCRECQKQSSSAFGISVIVPFAALRVRGGETRQWSRLCDSGRTTDCTFCVACGARLFHRGRGEPTVSVKGGALDIAPDLSGVVHIWTVRKLPGVVIPPGATQFPGEPDD
jgi:hypothetical protein